MSYVLPAFNLTVNIWDPTGPLPRVPDRVTVGNLAWGRRQHQGQAGMQWRPAGLGGGIVLSPGTMTLLLPAHTDVRPMDIGGFYGAGSLVEVPAGTGRFYLCSDVDDIGKGFANEHRAAILIKNTTAIQLLTGGAYGPAARWSVAPIP